MDDSRIAYISNQVMPLLKQKLPNIKSIKFEPTLDKKAQDNFQSAAIFGELIIEYEGKDEDYTGENKRFDGKEDAEECKRFDGKEDTDKSKRFGAKKDPGSCNDESNAIENTSPMFVKARESRIGVLIKLQLCDRLSAEWNNGGLNFFNEIFFYNNVVPYFSTKVDVRTLCTEMIHGYFSDEGKRQEDIVVLRNLNDHNYRLTTARVFLSLEHILLALRQLGKFHACSYILKGLDREQFMAKVSSLKDIRVWMAKSSSPYYTFCTACATRAVAYVEGIPEYQNKLSNLKEYIAHISERLPLIFKPNEKMSVLCHGDLTRNNMLFKYADAVPNLDTSITGTNDEKQYNEASDTSITESNDEKLCKGTSHPRLNTTETPTDVKFIDWADVVYATPVLDLALFLFLSTSQQLRSTHWDTMIQTYYASLRSETDKFQVAVPSYEDMCDEFKDNCMLAFFVSSFFLPQMMTKPKERCDWINKSEEENMKEMLECGGAPASKATGEVLMHMIDRGFI
ncbi:hypothetical protein M8J75_014615 [Diaphorina citri]|nr:hypothetical protein M8J75_014615 [Diaphorina citri]